jgi:hypothetical protein
MPGEPEPEVPVAAPRRGLASWPIRNKLIALVAAPLLLILGAGVFFTFQSTQTLRTDQRAADVANTALLTNTLSSALSTEMDATVTWTRASKLKAARQQMTDARGATDAAYRALQAALVSPPGGSWSLDVENARDSLTDVISRLPAIRKGAERGYAPLVIHQSYTRQLTTALDLTNTLARELSITAPDPQTVDASSTLSALANAAKAAADESVRLTTAIQESRLSDNTGVGLQELKVTQATELDQAFRHATQSQRDRILSIRTDDDRLEDFRQSALLAAKSDSDNADLTPAQVQQAQNTANTRAATFSVVSRTRVTRLNQLVADVTAETRDQARTNTQKALFNTILIATLALLTLALAAALVTVVARTVTVPLRRLRAGAVDAATVRLPAMVRQIEREGSDTLIALPPVLPPGTLAGPETYEVAQAVDGLTSEAVRLATAQVRLRQALDEAFVSMSRRSQSMVEKQLAIIDELESTEEDPDQLRNLFRLDHLAARMRRYNDNLLVLAGSTLRTRSAAPVPIAGVFRAATSEIVQYDPVRLHPVKRL